MNYRLELLEEHNITLSDVQAQIAKLQTLPGAFEFLQWARLHYQVAIISDTFYEFAAPLMAQLQQPFCSVTSWWSSKIGLLALSYARLIQSDARSKRSNRWIFVSLRRVIHSTMYQCWKKLIGGSFFRHRTMCGKYIPSIRWLMIMQNCRR